MDEKTWKIASWIIGVVIILTILIGTGILIKTIGSNTENKAEVSEAYPQIIGAALFLCVMTGLLCCGIKKYQIWGLKMLLVLGGMALVIIIPLVVTSNLKGSMVSILNIVSLVLGVLCFVFLNRINKRIKAEAKV